MRLRFAASPLALAFGFFLGLLVLVTEGSARDLEQVGGSGGGPYESACRPGDVLVGLGVNLGLVVDSVGAVCAPLNSDKTRWAAPTTYSPPRAGGSGGGQQPVLCRRDDAVMAIRVSVGIFSKLLVVTGVEITCGTMASPLRRYKVSALSAQSSRIRGQRDLSCYGSGSEPWAVGIFGRSGTYVDSLGVKCGLTPVGGGVSPASGESRDLECRRYGNAMVAMGNEARSLKCDFIQGGSWGDPRGYWLRQCMQKDGQSYVDYNLPALKKQLDACKAAGGGTPGDSEIVKVSAEVTMYNAFTRPNKRVCFLFPGDTLTKLAAEGATPPWFHLKGNSGQCKDKSGFVFNQGEFK